MLSRMSKHGLGIKGFKARGLRIGIQLSGFSYRHIPTSIYIYTYVHICVFRIWFLMTGSVCKKTVGHTVDAKHPAWPEV